MSNIAISYARFSSAPQGEGHSLTRQLENAQKYADQHGLVIDRKLRDEGFSAWDGSNISKGTLGKFLKLVEAGKVPQGATLIVESFDRLSRATPRQALPIFTSIWPAAGSVDTNLGSLSLFELDRTDIAKRRVSARWVVEPLDVVEHICLDIITRSVDLARDPFGLH